MTARRLERKIDEIDPDLAKMLADKGMVLCGVYQPKEYMAELDKADKDGSKER
jgi:hypothetical protein